MWRSRAGDQRGPLLDDPARPDLARSIARPELRLCIGPPSRPGQTTPCVGAALDDRLGVPGPQGGAGRPWDRHHPGAATLGGADDPGGALRGLLLHDLAGDPQAARREVEVGPAQPGELAPAQAALGGHPDRVSTRVSRGRRRARAAGRRSRTRRRRALSGSGGGSLRRAAGLCRGCAPSSAVAGITRKVATALLDGARRPGCVATSSASQPSTTSRVRAVRAAPEGRAMRRR